MNSPGVQRKRIRVAPDGSLHDPSTWIDGPQTRTVELDSRGAGEITDRQPRGFEAELRDLVGIADIAREQNDAAEPEFARERLELHRNLLSIEPGDEELPDLAAKRGR
jgi:hypothetical protein